MSTVLPYAGTYNCDISLPCSCCAGPAADSRIQCCISTISTTPDAIVSNYIGYYTLSAGTPYLHFDVQCMFHQQQPYMSLCILVVVQTPMLF